MSIISLQFGQCGNQIGHDFLSLIWQDIGSGQPLNTCDGDYTAESIDRWFSRKSKSDQLYSRSLMVDTERKVVDDIYTRQCNAIHSWVYEKRNVIAQKGGGAGNNWSIGYMKKGLELEEAVLDAVRMEAEQSDRVTSLLSILSSAGGTGSGVGSYLTERLRDEFSSKIILSAIVLPYQTGEVITQNYNTVLTMSKLYDASDIITIFENDYLHTMSSKLLGITDVEISDLNYFISSKMASFLQPTSDPLQRISTVVNHLSSHPAYKLITLKTSPHIPKSSATYGTLFTWPRLVKHMKQILRVNTDGREKNADWEMKQPSTTHRNSLMQYASCVSNAVFTRGNGSEDLKSSLQELKEARLYPKWLPQNSRVLHAHQNRQFLDTNNFVTLATNNHLIYHPLDEITRKAWDTYKHKAYLHLYDQHGVSEDDFYVAFSKIESVIKSYRDLCKK